MKNLLSLEDSDRISKLCERYHIKNYTINPDGSVDVDGDVMYYTKKYEQAIAINFNKINGSFDCGSTSLTTLENAPNEVMGDFFCNNNQLTSLVGGPVKVHGSYYCNENTLGTLEGCAQEIGGHLNCDDTHLTNLDFLPNKLGGDLYFDYNHFDDPLLRVDDDQNDLFNKYKDHYDVWAPELSMENFKGLLTDIKDGLQ